MKGHRTAIAALVLALILSSAPLTAQDPGGTLSDYIGKLATGSESLSGVNTRGLLTPSGVSTFRTQLRDAVDRARFDRYRADCGPYDPLEFYSISADMDQWNAEKLLDTPYDLASALLLSQYTNDIHGRLHAEFKYAHQAMSRGLSYPGCVDRVVFPIGQLTKQWAEHTAALARVYASLGKEGTEARSDAVIMKKAAEVFRTRGDAALKNKEYDQAMAHYTKSLEIDPENFKSHLYVGEVYYVQKNYDKAIETWAETIKRFPKEWMGYAWLGDAYHFNKDYDRAILNYKKTLELNPNDGTYRILGDTYREKKDYPEALASYRKALELKPNEPRTHSTLGALHEETGDLPEAVKAYERFLELDPKNSDAQKIREKIEELRRKHSTK